MLANYRKDQYYSEKCLGMCLQFKTSGKVNVIFFKEKV